MYGREPVDLGRKYDFQPAVSVENFLTINKTAELRGGFKLSKAMRKIGGGSRKADFLRGMVLCGDCSKTMIVGISTKKDKQTREITERRLYFRCETEGCPFKNKSVRGKVLMDFVLQFTRDNPFTSKECYQHYVEEMKRENEKKVVEIENDLRSQNRILSNLADRRRRLKEKLLEETDRQLTDEFKIDLKECDASIKQKQKSVEALKATREGVHQSVPTYETFLELYGNLAKKLAETIDMQWRDQVIRKIFLNFTVKDKKVASYSTKPPFSGFVGQGSVLDGRASGTRTHGLIVPNDARYQLRYSPLKIL